MLRSLKNKIKSLQAMTMTRKCDEIINSYTHICVSVHHKGPWVVRKLGCRGRLEPVGCYCIIVCVNAAHLLSCFLLTRRSRGRLRATSLVLMKYLSEDGGWRLLPARRADRRQSESQISWRSWRRPGLGCRTRWPSEERGWTAPTWPSSTTMTQMRLKPG